MPVKNLIARPINFASSVSPLSFFSSPTGDKLRDSKLCALKLNSPRHRVTIVDKICISGTDSFVLLAATVPFLIPLLQDIQKGPLSRIYGYGCVSLASMILIPGGCISILQCFA